jgi:tRNA(fMet)-specific endonuclease VapC
MLGVSVHVICELRAGAELSRQALREHEALDQLLSGLAVAYPDDRFAPAFARLLAATSRSGRPVAAMDLLIATAATLDDAPLVTRNVKDFSRVPGLRVLRCSRHRREAGPARGRALLERGQPLANGVESDPAAGASGERPISRAASRWCCRLRVTAHACSAAV